MEALLEPAKDTMNVYRDMRFRDFCPTFQDARKNVRFRDVFIGSGEVHWGGEGRVYAAPALVVQYVADHGHQPPREIRRRGPGDVGGKVTGSRAERRSAGTETQVDVLLRRA